MGLFHQEDSMSTLNLGNTGIEKAETVNQKEAEESNGFHWMFRIFTRR